MILKRSRARAPSIPTRVIRTEWGVKTIAEYKDGSVFCYGCGRHIKKNDVAKHNKEMCVP